MNKLFVLVAIIAAVLCASTYARTVTLTDIKRALATYDETNYEIYDEEAESDYELMATYTVKSGDTLSAIAARFGCTVAQLVSLNNIKDGSQCGGTWGSRPIGSSTVCKIGCLLTSITVGLRAHGVTVPGYGTSYNPGNVADYFTSHGGFSGNLVIHSTVTKISGNSSYLGQSQLTAAQLKQKLKDGVTCIANVNSGGHWVIVYGYNDSQPSTFKVRDSGAGRDTFNISEMGNIAMYKLRP